MTAFIASLYTNFFSGAQRTEQNHTMFLKQLLWIFPAIIQLVVFLLISEHHWKLLRNVELLIFSWDLARYSAR